MTEAYHVIARDVGRRPRRHLCLEPWTLIPAALVGLIAGIAISGVVGHASRQGDALRPINCALRADPFSDLQRVGFEAMRGVCTLGGGR